MNVIATIRRWHVELYRYELTKLDSPFKGDWWLITDPKELETFVAQTEPRYIFFPHWSEIVPEWIWRDVECVCFHETPVPYGRGGSPVQNMIKRGHTHTVITALRMTGELDAGPVYRQEPLSLSGLLEEIGIRIAKKVARMILWIVENEPEPMPQDDGSPVVRFKRREPWQSEIPEADDGGLVVLFDHIRMLDAEGYPRAFLERGGFRFEFSRPALRVGRIEADVRITEA